MIQQISQPVFPLGRRNCSPIFSEKEIEW